MLSCTLNDFMGFQMRHYTFTLIEYEILSYKLMYLAVP